MWHCLQLTGNEWRYMKVKWIERSNGLQVALYNSCCEKFRKIHRKKPAMESFFSSRIAS